MGVKKWTLEARDLGLCVANEMGAQGSMGFGSSSLFFLVSMSSVGSSVEYKPTSNMLGRVEERWCGKKGRRTSDRGF